jgi:hypothetical protein
MALNYLIGRSRKTLRLFGEKAKVFFLFFLIRRLSPWFPQWLAALKSLSATSAKPLGILEEKLKYFYNNLKVPSAMVASGGRES